MKKRKKIDPSDSGILHNPFLEISGEPGLTQSAEVTSGDDCNTKSPETDPTPFIEVIERVILRKEKKGRSGKTVTVLEIRPADKVDLPVLSKSLKSAIGCGGKIEGTLIVLQGDIAGRVEDWFKFRGISKITRG